MSSYHCSSSTPTSQQSKPPAYSRASLSTVLWVRRPHSGCRDTGIKIQKEPHSPRNIIDNPQNQLKDGATGHLTPRSICLTDLVYLARKWRINHPCSRLGIPKQNSGGSSFSNEENSPKSSSEGSCGVEPGKRSKATDGPREVPAQYSQILQGCAFTAVRRTVRNTSSAVLQVRFSYTAEPYIG